MKIIELRARLRRALVWIACGSEVEATWSSKPWRSVGNS